MIKWIKWGDTPLVLLFLSPITMFSFTFLILNGVEGIIANLPRGNQAQRNEITVRTKSRRICREEMAGAN